MAKLTGGFLAGLDETAAAALARAMVRRQRIIPMLERAGLSRSLMEQFRWLEPQDCVTLGEEVLAGGAGLVTRLNEAERMSGAGPSALPLT